MLSDGSEAYTNMISYHNDAFVVPWGKASGGKSAHIMHNIISHRVRFLTSHKMGLFLAHY